LQQAPNPEGPPSSGKGQAPPKPLHLMGQGAHGWLNPGSIRECTSRTSSRPR